MLGWGFMGVVHVPAMHDADFDCAIMSCVQLP